MQWLYLFFVIAPIEWIAAGKKWHKIRVITKPLSLIALIIWFYTSGGFSYNGWWFGTGLIFSLIGDIFLLLRGRYFIAGLFSFLCAHLCYITGFMQGPINFSWKIFIPASIVVLIGLSSYPRIIGGLRRRMEQRRLLIPVILYMLTITTMLFSALLTWFQSDWSFWAALFASIGAVLFTISDSLLAAGRFLRPVPYGNFLVMFTYQLGQLGIAAGFLIASGNIQFLNPVL